MDKRRQLIYYSSLITAVVSCLFVKIALLPLEHSILLLHVISHVKTIDPDPVPDHCSAESAKYAKF